MLIHFFISNLVRCLQPTAIAAMPKDVIREHPRHSNVFNLVHFDIDIKEASVTDLQYDMLIISRSGQP